MEAGLSRFGDLSDADRERAGQISATAKEFAERNADFIAAASADRRGVARRQLDSAFSAIDDARRHVSALDSNELRNRFSRYFDALEDYADAADRFLAHYETPGPADTAAEAQLSRDFQRAARAVQREDREFIAIVIDAAPADKRDDIRDRVQDLEKELLDQAAP